MATKKKRPARRVAPAKKKSTPVKSTPVKPSSAAELHEAARIARRSGDVESSARLLEQAHAAERGR